jgi:peptide/nickel transport system substrate-binding protein
VERIREGIEPRSANELIQARIDGRLSRRDLVRRATALGFAAPVIATMLHATSDYAFGAPNPRRAPGAVAAQDATSGTVPATAPTVPEGTPREGGTLVVSTTSEPDTLHPWLTQLVTTADVYAAVSASLLAYDSSQQLIPVLATGFEISDDALTYTFALRQGVTWHNGDPFTAQDFIDSQQMRTNPDFGAWFIQGWENIVDMRVEGETNLVLTINEVFAPFLSYVAPGDLCPSAAIAKGVDAFTEEFNRTPYGTGPFELVEWTAGEQIVLERYDGYYGTRPTLDRIVYRIVPDDNTQLVQLRTGEIQVAASSGTIAANRVDEALEIEGIQILEHLTQDWQHLDLKNIGFLLETPVRQALDFATPSQLIIDQLLQGRAVPCIGDQAPGTWAHNPNIQPRPYDLEQAKALLDGVGLVPNADGVRERDGVPFEMELWFVAGTTLDEQISQVIAESWNSIGVKTEVFSQDISTIWGPDGYQFNEKMTACLYTWTNSVDPDDIFYWHSSQIPATPDGTGGNVQAYFNPYNFQAEIDDLTSRAARITDQEERKVLYWQIQELLHEEVPCIFIYWPKAFSAAATNLGGFWPSAFNFLTWNAQDWYLTE